MPPKRRRPLREIEASRIVLRDAAGNTRILLDAGGESGHACLCVFAADARAGMQVGTQPGGAVVMSFDSDAFAGMLTLSAEGITLRARDGKLGVVVGRAVDGQDSVSVFRDGRRVWHSPAPPPPGRPKRKKPRRRNGGGSSEP